MLNQKYLIQNKTYSGNRQHLRLNCLQMVHHFWLCLVILVLVVDQFSTEKNKDITKESITDPTIVLTICLCDHSFV